MHTADLALSQKLAEELKYEQEANSEAEEPESLTTFKKRGTWEVRQYRLHCFSVY
jgi:complement component 1 Q subcomponent-binding protein